MINLEHKTIVITGAAGALGTVIAKHLTDLGARVAALDILTPDEAAAALDLQPGRLDYWQCDTADIPSCQEALKDIAARLGMPDVVCCHAGLVGVAPIEGYDADDFDRLMQVNLRGAFVLAQAAVKQWLDTGATGQLIFTTSWVHDHPWPEITPYAASKAGLNALMRGFARELAGRGIRANAIAPGIVAAGMALKTWNENAEYRARASVAIPLGELQPVESVANAFAFMCSDLSAYMTGSVLTVDGGCSLYPNI
ncbi:SDR family NAD(P)-dependent oxidoreductase [Nitratireductor sp. XY-223]|uniref:SDR family NAD(P)-dependent oxidoreductase n=1 Tax=Nitratireductor sp. XY-223 TaxID=2561926 RepID=UPI0010AB32C3|nr:SDR family NAD(P)-dependent oxidoreductase [Nitratireductor sp. XY-223]